MVCIELAISSDREIFSVAKVSKVLSDEKYVVSPYDANLVILAIESRFISLLDILLPIPFAGLSMLIVYSYDEDRYGVVQKSLEPIIGQMLELIKSIDTYFRSRAVSFLFSALPNVFLNFHFTACVKSFK